MPDVPGIFCFSAPNARDAPPPMECTPLDLAGGDAGDLDDDTLGDNDAAVAGLVQGVRYGVQSVVMVARLFCWRPAGVVLLATGSFSPWSRVA